MIRDKIKIKNLTCYECWSSASASAASALATARAFALAISVHRSRPIVTLDSSLSV